MISKSGFVGYGKVTHLAIVLTALFDTYALAQDIKQVAFTDEACDRSTHLP